MKKNVTIGEVAQAIPIQEFALNEYGLKPIKKSKYWSFAGEKGISGDGSSIMIYPNNTYCSFSKYTGGNLVNFIMEMDNTNLMGALEHLYVYYHEHGVVLQNNGIILPKPLKKDLSIGIPLPEKAENNNAVIGYLYEKRKIALPIIMEFIDKHYLYQDTYKNCVFIGYYKNNPVFGFSRSTGTENQLVYKRDIAGSFKEVGLYIDNKSDILICCEAIIDGMSIMTKMINDNIDYHNFNWLLMSGAGVFVKSFEFNFIQRMRNVKIVRPALDNDEKGLQNIEKFKNYCAEKHPEIIIDPLLSKAKDHNLDLQSEISDYENDLDYP